jgi:hypothetical protein
MKGLRTNVSLRQIQVNEATYLTARHNGKELGGIGQANMLDHKKHFFERQLIIFGLRAGQNCSAVFDLQFLNWMPLTS